MFELEEKGLLQKTYIWLPERRWEDLRAYSRDEVTCVRKQSPVLSFDIWSNRLVELLTVGQMTPGDLKVTYRGHQIREDGKLKLQLGIVSWYDIPKDSYEVSRKMEFGKRYFGDPKAFFSLPVGPANILITSDSKLALPIRAAYRKDGKMMGLPLFLHLVAGFEDAIPNWESRNLDYIIKRLKTPSYCIGTRSLFKGVDRELYEETDVKPKDIVNKELVGIVTDASNFGNTDIVFETRIRQDSEWFREGGEWTKARDAWEHVGFIVFSNGDQIRSALNDGRLPTELGYKGISFAARFALEYALRRLF